MAKQTIYNAIAVGMVLAGTILSGCNNPSKSESNASYGKDTIPKIDSLTYTNDMNTYKERMNDTLATIDKKMDDFKAKMKHEGNEAKADYKKAIADLDEQRKELKKKLDEYSDKGKDKWEDFKKGFNNDMDTLSKKFKDLTSSDKSKS